MLITNNDTESIKYLQIYQRIKSHWDFSSAVHDKQEFFRGNLEIKVENNRSMLPVFVVADIAMENSSPFMREIISSEVSKLKKFIGGY